MREALFNILAARLELAGLTVLDLYAGSGALGLEALSRGAAAVTFVEQDPRAAEVITQNAAALGLSGATVIRRTVAAVIRDGAERAVDLVLADPPYEVDAAEVERVLATLATEGWTKPDTVVVVERRTSSAPLTWPNGWTPWESRRYGDTRLEMAEAGGAR